MSKTTYDEIPMKIEMREPFEGSSASAERTDNLYRVYSYDTLIATYEVIKEDVGLELVYFDYTQYSSTTTRLQNIIIDVEGLYNGNPTMIPRERYARNSIELLQVNPAQFDEDFDKGYLDLSWRKRTK